MQGHGSLRELGHLGEAARERQSRDRRFAKVLQQAAREIAHFDQLRFLQSSFRTAASEVDPAAAT